MNEYEYMQRRKHLTLGAIGFVAFCFVANSVKADNTTIQDHYKNVIHKKQADAGDGQVIRRNPAHSMSSPK